MLLLLLVFFISATGILYVYRSLPDYIENKTRQLVLQQTPFTRFNADIHQTGLFETEIDDIVLGGDQYSTLSINSIKLRYSPLGLLQKKLKGIDIDKLDVFLELNEGQFSIPGLDLGSLEKKGETTADTITIPVYLEKLQVNEGILHISVDNKPILIPFTLTLVQQSSNQPSLYTTTLQIYPDSEKVTFAADLDLTANKGLVKITSESLQLEKFIALVHAMEEFQVAGLATIQAVSEMKLQPAETLTAVMDISLQPFFFKYNEIILQSSEKSPDNKPLKLTVEYKNKEIQYQADNILLNDPFGATFGTKGTLDIAGEKLTGFGDYMLAVKKVPILSIKEQVKLSGDVNYGYDRLSGNWHFNLAKNEILPAEKIKVQIQDVLIETGVPDYVVTGNGSAGSGRVSFSATNPLISIISDDLQGEGSLFLKGELQFEEDGLQGKMQAELHNGRLEFTENKHIFEEISLSVKFPVLPQMRTEADQVLRFSKASFGDFSITNGMIEWQLESPDSLYLKNSVFQWAGGNLHVNDVRLSLAKEKQFITIVCERLDLIEMLQQLGIKDAAGEGTVSGQIPLLLGKGTIDFKDGLLSSSKGEGGRIRIAAFDLLSTGIPKNSPQFSQIDFAAEALKDFRYNWVKLFLNSTGDELVMQLQLDGQPMHPLPFAYNKNGTFTRIEAGGQGIIRPIRLDVNFRFPLNRFLGYSGRIQEIMEKIQ